MNQQAPAGRRLGHLALADRHPAEISAIRLAWETPAA
jgi:hypothetical protein